MAADINCYAIGKAAYDNARLNGVSDSTAKKIQNATESVCVAERKKAAEEQPKTIAPE